LILLNFLLNTPAITHFMTHIGSRLPWQKRMLGWARAVIGSESGDA